MKRTVLREDDPAFEESERRVVIMHDDSEFWPPDEWDHPLKLWSNSSRLRGDRDAECPFERDDSGEWTPAPGKIVFPVSVLDHGGLAFALGHYSFASDPGGWDTICGALYMYADRSTWESMCGAWRGEDDETFVAEVRKAAEGYVEELNLAERDQLWGFVVQVRRLYTKTYSDGETVCGSEWQDEDSCWGYLTTDVDDIEFPRDPDVPVFSDSFAGDTYTIPEFAVTRTSDATDGASDKRLGIADIGDTTEKEAR